MRTAIEKKLITGIIIAIAMVFAIVIISLWQTRRMQDAAAIVRHTNQVLYGTKEVLDLSTRYDLCIKNYLLTKDSVFLDSAERISVLLPERIGIVRDLTQDNPSQQMRLDSLYRYIYETRHMLERAIVMNRNDIPGAAAVLIDTGSRRGYAHRARLVIDAMEGEEWRLLDLRRKANQHSQMELQWFLWGLAVVVVLLAWVTFQKLRIDLEKDKKDMDRLNQFNQQLEDRVRIQTANLQSSEEKYKTLFYKSPLPKWIYDQDTLRFLEVNDAAIQHYGYSQEEFQGMSILDIRPAEDKALVLKDIEEVRHNSDSYSEGNWRHVRRNGEIIYVEITAHPIQFEGKKARMVVVNDVTEKRRHEQVLKRLNEDLKKRATELASSNAELERFAYIASHDLQEPLRMVSSFLQLLQKRYDGQLDEKAHQYIHYAVDGSERMKTLILDLLEYSRVGSKEDFGPVDMSQVMGEVGDIFRDKIIATRARIEISHLPMVRGDKVQLTQLMQNLVGNALKYHGDSPPVVKVWGKEIPGYWQFSVQDNGIGIDPSFFDKIFIIFQRLHNKSTYSGTGIGLAICKKIVERHGGRIWVESTLNQGSTFSFTLANNFETQAVS